ncbi:hypothetical protein B0H19DRAFT_1317209 [Mycena capillaripes]|nr:hypothetical protein B0H19DRAFT_1317209 [Mycena capillaripes]
MSDGPSGKAEAVRGGDGQWEDSEVSARAGLKAMLGRFVKQIVASVAKSTPLSQLPDMDFPINAKAKGRVVVVPWEHVAYPNSTQPVPHLGLWLFCRVARPFFFGC